MELNPAHDLAREKYPVGMQFQNNLLNTRRQTQEDHADQLR